MIKLFDVDQLTRFAISEIKKFAENHQEETFYGLSIDANLLCINSIESFDKTLKEYKEMFDDYDSEEEVLELKLNTGDWQYQGFAEFGDEDGFNSEAYLKHYHASDQEQLSSDYAKTMDEVVKRLKESDAFDNLKKTGDFFINRVEHDY